MTLRVGLVGYGAIARRHREAIELSRGAELVALATSQPDPKIPGVSVYSDFDQLLAARDVDAIVICTPSGYHAKQALSALKAGKHVVVEKPLCLDFESGEAVVREARRRNLVVAVISQRRFEAQNIYLKRLLTDGQIGKLYLGEVLLRWHRSSAYYETNSWRGTREFDGGVLMNQAIHTIDLLRWFFGPVIRVSSEGATLAHRIESEDTAVGTIRFESGALGIVAATTASPRGLPVELNIFAERGRISFHDDRTAAWEVEGVAPPPTDSTTSGSGSAKPDGITAAGHARQWRDIVEAFAEGRDPIVTAEEGLKTVAVVLAMQEAWRLGRAVSPAVS